MTEEGIGLPGNSSKQHTTVLGDLLEFVDMQKRLLAGSIEPADGDEDNEVPSDEGEPNDKQEKAEPSEVMQAIGELGVPDFMMSEEIDELGKLEMNELDNVVSFADNQVMRLIFNT